ncbi:MULTISPECIES: hypothetical protein [Chryseobacterium]|uniref:hypothetical protein n=1 Tax=Chryseobacterium TaxID=59732 RepID=UPI00195CFC16|nr:MULTISPECIES: hypothetical protein [Chryseobacterium]MBM7419919.1 hypothetical protein [Chryseobacterium sp. JUb44]MDH6209857.1 hypothetical protein [Chryseobacterium sp. BIGb0186]WSO08594.1 hypothetical protein VUJ64_12230 [Chryseobacterium scophthalmum]
MKNKFITTLFVLISIFSFAQAKANSEEIEIKKSLTYFLNSIKAKKMNQAVDCIYPKYFTVISKEQMTQILEMTYNNPLLKIDIQDLSFGVIEKPELIDGEYFSITNYGFKLQCDVSSMNDETQNKIETAMKAKYGQNNVQLLKKGVYVINAKMRACAISTDKKYWKFLILEKHYKHQLVRILPKKILDKI